MTEQQKLKTCLDHLRLSPLDHNGCAKLVGLGLLDFLAFRGMHIQAFQEVEEETYNLMEHLCMMKALGQELPEKYADFSYEKAKWVLQVRKGWSKTQKIEQVQPAPQETSNGYAEERLNKYFKNQPKVLSKTDGWDVQ